ncbi:MAG: hypothetical protein KA408_14680 [Flavobacteriales bacterium]|nr:hypothetical protein [Flavobacteriales bacterium]
MNRLLLFLIAYAFAVVLQGQSLFNLERSIITFLSEAPLETITSTNKAATGLIDPEERTFVIRIPIDEFLGFNSPLQYEHFNENYMNSRSWAYAYFKGRIIEAVDLDKIGTQEVRAKGELNIRGEVRERIIPCKLVVAEDGIRVTSSFEVELDQHAIRIPRVVQQKIAPIVHVSVDLLFQRTKDRE